MEFRFNDVADLFEKTLNEELSKLSSEEQNELLERLNDDNYWQDRIQEGDAECAQILKDRDIDKLAGEIRSVVVSVVDINHNPYPYIYKKNIPRIRDAHASILSASTEVLKLAVEYAKQDMFIDDFSKIEEYVDESLSFFNQYTSNPDALNVDAFKDYIADKYKSEIEYLF